MKNPSCQICQKELNVIRRLESGYFWCYNCEVNNLLKKLILKDVSYDVLLSENLMMRTALNDIIQHSKHPFVGEKWTKYVHELAKEAVKK